MVSIIIRTKNEEKWIASCLKQIFKQDFKDIEIILVDNNSSDKTVEKARAFGIKVTSVEQYNPGQAINSGIRQSSGELIAILSAHCIPTNNKWLSNLVRNFEDPQVAGVYGRQEPFSFTSDQDKRDLLNTFGLDRRIQKKDSFFHNANSMIRRDVWDQIPFDENITNIEDRIWAKQVLEKGFTLIYEPDASVYHWHGIHQNGDEERCRNVVRILESLNIDQNGKSYSLDLNNLSIAAIIPDKGEPTYLNGTPLMAYTINRAKESKLIDQVIFSTDNQASADLARSFGAQTPFLRPPYLSEDYVDVTTVFQYTLEELEKSGYYPDLVVLLQITFPFRPKGFLDKLVKQLVDRGLDSVLAAHPEYKSCWIKENETLSWVGKGMMPRQFKDPLYIGLHGLATVTHPSFLRQGNRFGEKIGMVEISDQICALEIRDEKALNMAGMIMPVWWEKNV